MRNKSLTNILFMIFILVFFTSIAILSKNIQSQPIEYTPDKEPTLGDPDFGIERALPKPSLEEILGTSIFGIMSYTPPALGYYETSEYMIGNASVGIILLESNGSIDSNMYSWNPSQESNVISEIQTGLNWWASQDSRANISWVYDIHYDVPTSYEPTSRSSSEEGLWINDAMNYLGYTGSTYWSKVYNYLNTLRTTKNTTWAFVIFVVTGNSRFTNNWFAYAYIQGPFMVMTYENDGWGIANMDKVTAHETGHIFGAGDMYCQPGYACCRCDSYYGYLNIQNTQCEAGCFAGYEDACSSCVQISCIMRDNAWTVCTTAAHQIGWRDTDGDNIFDPVDACSSQAGPACNNGCPSSAPSITIHSPVNTTYYSATSTMSIWANITLDRNANWCKVSIDNDSNQTMTNSSSNWNYLMTLSEGSHNVKFYCSSVCNEENSTSNYFSVSLNTPPQYGYQSIYPSSPAIYSPTQQYQFNLTWNDVENNFEQAIFESNYTGTLLNYTKNGVPAVQNDSALNFYIILPSIKSSTFVYRWYGNDTIGQWNSTSQSTYTINKAPNPIQLYLNGNLNQNVTINYGIQSNTTAVGGFVILYRDGILKSNPEIIQLPAGTYAYKANSSGNENYTANGTGVTFYLIVNHATPQLNLSASPSWSNTYPTETAVSCSDDNLETTALMYRDGVQKTSPEIKTFGVGSYTYICNTTITQNYTSNTTSNTLTINKNTSVNNFMNLTINGTESDKTHSYPAVTNITTWNFIPELNFILERNGTLLSTPHIIQYPVGSYNFTYYTQGNNNYSSASKSYVLTITKALPTIFLSFSPSDTNIYGTQTTATCSIVTGDPTSTLTLYQNGTSVSSGIGAQQETTTLGSGAYNYTCIYSESQNYSSSSASDTLTITKASNEANIYINGNLISGRLTTLNDSSTAKNITFGSNENKTIFISLPKSATVSFARLNLSGYIKYVEDNTTIKDYSFEENKIDFTGNWSNSTSYCGDNWQRCQWRYDSGTSITGDFSIFAYAHVMDTLENHWITFWQQVNFPSDVKTLNFYSKQMPAGNYDPNRYCRLNISKNILWSTKALTNTTSTWTAYNASIESFAGTTNNYMILESIVLASVYHETAIGCWWDDITLIREIHPHDVYLDIGNDGDKDWKYSGKLNHTDNITNDFSQEINDYLSTCSMDSNVNCDVPIILHSNTAGTIQISAINITFEGNKSITYDNITNVTAIGIIGGIANFYRNDILVSNPEITTLGRGTYEYKYNTSGNENYTGVTRTSFLIINPKVSICSLAFNPSSPIIYGTSTKAICSCTNPESYANLYRDNSLVNPENDTQIVLSGGSHEYICNVTSTQNYTLATTNSSYTVNKAGAVIRLYLNDSEQIGDNPNLINRTYGDYTNITVVLNISGQPIVILRNSTQIASGTSPLVFVTNNFAAVSYLINTTYEGNDNYTSDSQIGYLIYNKNSPNSFMHIAVNGSELDLSKTYPNSTNVTGWSAVIQDMSFSLYRNNQKVTNPENTLLGAGNYTYVFNTSGGQNYTQGYVTRLVNVTKGSPALSLTIKLVPDTGAYPIPITYPKQTNVTASFITVNNEGNNTLYLYRNGTIVNNPEITFLGAGTWNYTALFLETQNYSSAIQYQEFTVKQNISTSDLLHLALNGTENNRTYGPSDVVNVTGWKDFSEGTLILYRDGNAICYFEYCTSQTPYEITTLEGGSYNYTMVYSSTQNYSSGSKTYFVYVDSTPPTISNIAITPSKIRQNSNVTFISKMTDLSGVSYAYLTGYDSTWHKIYSAQNLSNISSSWYLTFNVSDRIDGIYYINLTAVDIFGNNKTIWATNFTVNGTSGANKVFTNTSVSTIDNKTTINATEIANTTLEIKTNQNISNAKVTIASYTENPSIANIGIPELNKYVEITTTPEINESLSWAIIKVYYNDSDIPSGYSENNLRIYYNHPNGTWIAYNNQSSKYQGGVNNGENYVWANTTHFSIYGVYIIPTCNDGIQNQGESGVDCGGPCSACSTGGTGGGAGGGGGGGGVGPEVKPCLLNGICDSWETPETCPSDCKKTPSPTNVTETTISVPPKPTEENRTTPTTEPTTEEETPTMPTGFAVLIPYATNPIMVLLLVIVVVAIVMYWKKLFIFSKKKT